MGSWIGYLWSAAGVSLVFGGTLQAFASMGALMAVLSWAMVALLGTFVAVTGARRVMAASDADGRADPEKALGKVDSRFGRR
ncbi:hypothetical protein ACFQE8_01420 [Salinirubellus sp. GCM10025818]|jgi:hypothetical protein|uniref:hypothetical protein n=1 Tax=Salinirubellus TaxID=2162630 RepID=UPI0030D426CD